MRDTPAEEIIVFKLLNNPDFVDWATFVD